MSITVEELRKLPIRRNPNFDYQDYRNRKEYYHKKVIPKIPVDADDPRYVERMDKCADYGILQLNYYVDGQGKEILRANGKESSSYLSRDIYLRRSILIRLQKVNQFLQRFGLELVILSGYRHPLHQKDCQAGVEAQDRPDNARPAKILFTNPDQYAPHCTGAALDVEIWDMRNHRMLLTKVPDREVSMGLFYLEELSILNLEAEEARGNRRLLHNVLATPAVLGKDHLIPHPSEYWHIAYGERLAKFLAANNHPACYERTYFVAP